MSTFTLLEPLLKARNTAELAGFLKTLDGRLSDLSRSNSGFLASLTDYVLTGEGKRVRPALVYLASQFGPSRKEEVMETALAVEMIHIATLIHDDLVDKAVTRRKKPTVGVQFGEGAAVLLGDHIYAEAFRRLALLNRPEIVRLFAEATAAMCDGEIGQYEARFAFDLSEADYLSFLRKKTASLMAASVRAGGELAGLSTGALDALEAFGNTIGTAFQIVDDVLDLEGDESVVGKTLRTDLMNGKMTLPLILFGKNLAPAEKQDFIETLKSPNGHVAGLLSRVAKSGVMEECRSRIQSLLKQAQESLALLPDHPSREILIDISRKLSDRKS